MCVDFEKNFIPLGIHVKKFQWFRYWNSKNAGKNTRTHEREFYDVGFGDAENAA